MKEFSEQLQMVGISVYCKISLLLCFMYGIACLMEQRGLHYSGVCIKLDMHWSHAGLCVPDFLRLLFP